jgi:hypothetical protein
MNSPETILRKARKAGLNGIAITDHHTMKAYPILKKLNKDKNLEIIPGEEITTNHGDVLALYIHEEIKSRDLLTVLKEIRSQGGVAIIPHPSTITHRLSFTYPLSKLKGKIDAIETFNSRNFRFSNNIAKREALRLNFPQVGSSDAHLPIDIGKCYTLFEGDLRTAIRKGKTTPRGTTRYGLFSFIITIIYKYLIGIFRVKRLSE